MCFVNRVTSSKEYHKYISNLFRYCLGIIFKKLKTILRSSLSNFPENSPPESPSKDFHRQERASRNVLQRRARVELSPMRSGLTYIDGKLWWSSGATPRAGRIAIRTHLTSVAIVARQCLILVSLDNALVSSPSRSHISSTRNASLRGKPPRTERLARR